MFAKQMKTDTSTSVRDSFRQVSVLFFENEELESQRGMKWEQSGPELGIGSLNQR